MQYCVGSIVAIYYYLQNYIYMTLFLNEKKTTIYRADIPEKMQFYHKLSSDIPNLLKM